MAFDRNNLVGEAEQSPRVLNKKDAKINRNEFLSHINDDKTHVTIEDRKFWNETRRFLKDYVDYRFKTIIGMFDFGEINIDNKLTLAEIILTMGKRLSQSIERERMDRIEALNAEIANRETAMTEEAGLRLGKDKELKELLDELRKDLTTEINDRKQAVADEAEVRANNDSNLNDSFQALQRAYTVDHQNMTDIIEQEIINRTTACNNLQGNINALIDKHNHDIAEIIGGGEVTIDLTNTSALLEQLTQVREELNQEILNRVNADNKEASNRLTADSELAERIAREENTRRTEITTLQSLIK